MADVTFQISDDHLTRFIDGIAGHFGYRETDIDGEANPETKAQYGKRKMRRQMIIWVNRYEFGAAVDAIDVEEIDVT